MRAAHGVGALVLAAAERAALEAGRTLLVLDTASPEAERLYERGGWQRVGTVPKIRAHAGRAVLQHGDLLQGPDTRMRRRDFLQHLGAGTALACLPLAMRETLAASLNLPDLVIAEVEILRISGPREATRGVTGQHQVQPLHLYPDRRPPVFKEGAPRQETYTARHHYLRIRTKGGQEGIYGYIDTEALPTISRTACAACSSARMHLPSKNSGTRCIAPTAMRARATT